MSGSVSCGGGGYSIVWFKRDLRVEDNPALAAAVRDGPVIPIFVWAPEEEGHYHPDPLSLVRDHRAKDFLTAQGIAVRTFNAYLLYEPWEVTDELGRPFSMFSAFWERRLSMPYDLKSPLLPPKKIISDQTGGMGKQGNEAGEESVNLFLKLIGLREYSRYISFNHPYFHERPLLGHLNFFPWAVDGNYFKAWRQGQTGYPLVDDGMRELWATVWLHDRIRVIVSSFFVKVLQLPWRWGMKYFWDTLLDADLESDTLGWQYITGTLPDSREFDRIDNPQFEGYKFDPDGPWNAPESVLQAAGIELGSNYPRPIVGLDEAKARLHEALSQMWQLESASRVAIENGSEEGLGGSTEVEEAPIAFPRDITMEETEPTRLNPIRRYEDQLVPSIISSLLRPEEDEESSLNLRNSVGDSREEVPRNMVNTNQTEQPRVELASNQVTAMIPELNIKIVAENTEDSTAESSSSERRGRDVGIVPEWSG